MPRIPRSSSKSSVRFNHGKIKELRDQEEMTQAELAEKAGVDNATVWRAENNRPVSLDSAALIASVFRLEYRSISTFTRFEKELSPSIQEPIFQFIPVRNSGENWRPDPSDVDETKGYCFRFYGEAEALVECSVAKIQLYIVRNDHLAICTSPGKSHFYHGSLVDEDEKYGFVKLDGHKLYVDGDCRLLSLLTFESNKKYLLSIHSWCRAIGVSRNDPDTGSLWYWLDDLNQVITVEYTSGGRRYAEEHVFYFINDTVMALKEKTIRILT